MSRGLWAGALVFALGAAQAPAPLIQNGKIENRSGTAIDREIAGLGAGGSEPVWAGWRVPIADGHRAGCCTYSDDGMGSNTVLRGCFVENPAAPDGRAIPQVAPASGAVALDAGTGLVLLMRLVGGRVERLRTLGDDCPLDAGGRTVYWLQSVSPSESVRFLRTLVANTTPFTRDQAQRLSNSAIAAIAMHRDPSAVEALLSTARSDADVNIRAEAAYWLAQRGGPDVTKAAMGLLDSDASETVQRRIVQGLARLPESDSTPLLLTLAQSGRSLAVRKAAVTALGRSKDPRARAYIEGLLR